MDFYGEPTKCVGGYYHIADANGRTIALLPASNYSEPFNGTVIVSTESFSR